jgi:hypothetical protein
MAKENIISHCGIQDESTLSKIRKIAFYGSGAAELSRFAQDGNQKRRLSATHA